MATPNKRVVSRPQRPGRVPKGSGTPSSPLDSPDWKAPQEQMPSQVAMLRKAQEFFQTCDTEGKGFIARRDMQRLHKELPLSLEDLEDVFDALDADGNGFLTPAEFTSGFSHFFYSQSHPSQTEAGDPAAELQEGKVYQSRGEEQGGTEEDEEAQFQLLMDRLGAQKILEDESDVQQLWLQLRKEEPHLLSNFEDFLARIFSHLQEAHEEKNELECALRKKIADYDEEIQHLYEEMEQQIKSEKEQFLLKDTERFKALSQDLQQRLSAKEQEVEQLLQKQKRLEGQCTSLHSDKQETKTENTKLKLTNQELARELEQTTRELQATQRQLESLQQDACRLHQEKEMEVYRVKENLQREKSGLLKQLDFLRERNKHLRDERDMCFQRDKAAKTNTAASKAGWKQRSGSVIGKYVDGRGILRSPSEEEEDVFGMLRRRSSLGLSGCPLSEGEPGAGEQPGPGVQPPRRLRRIISIEEDHLPQLLDGGVQRPLSRCPEEQEVSEQRGEGQAQEAPPLEPTPTAPRGQPVGKEALSKEESSPSSPDRLFKIVLVGNSSVGKTSFLRRFCENRFAPGMAATVGIDYRVKTVTVDESRVALQLWDTAGQERYRCITQQFFRKADGVIVMYDLTAKQSFLSVRQWLSSVEEAVGDRIPVLLLGNKTDKEKEREVPRGLGEQLAKENSLIFYECSASSGHNAQESLLHLARILKEQEDTVKEDTIQVSTCAKKSSCCGR
ncbi:EF-hand calcium-binding domain-containing protein 4B [Tenrec ecaudatus]|uniref:EF-hand calcium-binding domain-containing protein 4B n=1 Tax=Tenrec ecaudatus TaxID=94439 RepID=UPI003F5906B1